MDAQTKNELVVAVNVLIQSPNAHHQFNMMEAVAPLLSRYKELRLSGEADDLYPLARFKVSHPEEYVSIVELIERKRMDRGFEPLRTDTDDKFDKAEYMQQFMQQKRIRQRRAADIENLQRGEREKLVGRARLDFMQRQSEQWKQERDALIDIARKAAHPRKLKREDISAVLEQFWGKLDAKLDALEAAARSGRYTGIKNTSLADLESALKYDPYKK